MPKSTKSILNQYLFPYFHMFTTHKYPLRIPDSYHAKTLKNHTPLVRYALYFYNQAIFDVLVTNLIAKLY